MAKEPFDVVDQLMYRGTNDGVFPGAVLLVARNGVIQFHEAYGFRNLFTRQVVTSDTVFDLASLTKPLVTTAALMLLVGQSKLDLDQPIGSSLDWLQGTDKELIPVRALLDHSAGMPAYRPFYRDLQKLKAAARYAALKQALAEVPLEAAVGGQTVYSDLGFMLLGMLVEEITGMPLDRYVRQTIFLPLGVGGKSEPRLLFGSPALARGDENVAASEICPWRNRLLEGIVHDENAFVIGGVAGHAGLFGDALAVFLVAQAFCDAYAGRSPMGLFQSETVREFLRRSAHDRRPLGFDAPSEKDSSCGRHFSANTVGHLGYTGTSLWIDLDRDIIVVLLTNRVHPSRLNERIRTFRPELHDAVMQAFFVVKTV